MYVKNVTMIKFHIHRYDALLGAKDNWEELCSRYTFDTLHLKYDFLGSFNWILVTIFILMSTRGAANYKY